MFMYCDQVLPSYKAYDGIGQETLLIREVLESLGFKSQIYAQFGYGVDDVLSLDDFPNDKNRNVIYQHSTGSDALYKVLKNQPRLICRYQNVTPPWFFPNSDPTAIACARGREQLKLLESFSEEIWASSHYNASDIASTICKVVPVQRNYRNLVDLSDDDHLRKNLLTKDTFLFVGRYVANKGIHDLVFYSKLFQMVPELQRSRIVVVGSGLQQQYMVEKVLPLCRELGVDYGIDNAG